MKAPSSRWSEFVDKSTDPVFVLNASRRIVFVNAAWETLTGVKLDDVRGWVCKRRPGEATPGSPEAVLQALAPPDDALAGKTTRVRRRFLKTASILQWWDLEFLPFAEQDGIGGIIGKITLIPQQSAAFAPLPERIVALRQRMIEWHRLDQIVSEVPAVQRLVAQIRQAAQTTQPLTIVGEAGSGKEWAARALHYRAAPEAGFACIDCSTLIESASNDLFGENGSLARLGMRTVCLKNPHRLPREVQGRVLETSATSRQVILAFTSNPQDEIRAGHLLEGFYYAASATTIEVPPLRDRRADLPWLIEHFMGRLAEGPREVSVEAMDVLRAHVWPGNLAELFDVLKTTSLQAKGPRIEVNDLPFYLRASPAPKERTLPLDTILEQVEKRLMLLALRLSNNNKTKAAEMLGVWRTRLVRRLEAFGMPPESEEE